MTQRWKDGAELRDIVFWDAFNGGTMDIDGTIKRSGNYSYVFGSAGGAATAYKLLGGNLSELYMRAAIYGTEYNLGQIGWSSLGNYSLGMYWDNYSRPFIYTGTFGFGENRLAYGDHARAPDWNLYEFYIKLANTDGRFIVKQNGLYEINYTGDTQPGSEAYLDAFYARVGTSGGIHLDDLALNDTTGEVDNSWCGDEHYEWHPANSNGYLNQWNGNDGNKVNNFELVDEIPPDGDTTFVFSNTASEIDAYGVTDFDPTNKVITRIWAENRARDANSLGGQMKLGFRVGSTNYLCAENRTLPSNYAKVAGDDALVNPATGLAWTEADFNSIQYVQENEA